MYSCHRCPAPAGQTGVQLTLEAFLFPLELGELLLNGGYLMVDHGPFRFGF